MDEPTSEGPLERALGPGMGPWQLLRLGSAVLVLGSLAGVVTRFLPPAEGRMAGVEGADRITLFFAVHALAWAAVFVVATRQARRRREE